MVSTAAENERDLEPIPRRRFSVLQLFASGAFILLVLDNFAFFSRLFGRFPDAADHPLFLLSTAFMLWLAILLMLLPFAHRYTARPALIFLLMAGALAAYFMDSYGTVIDAAMLENVWQTDLAEARELLTPRLFVYLLLFGVFPSLWVWKLPLRHGRWWRELGMAALMFLLGLVLMLVMMWGFGEQYSRLFKHHRQTVSYANPVMPANALAGWLRERLGDTRGEVLSVAPDAHWQPLPGGKIPLRVMVVGESLRADHLSLNGYTRLTTPLLQQYLQNGSNLVSFDRFFACDTATATSVPCMFSLLDQAHFDRRRGDRMENLLDIAKRAGVEVLWIDNNSSSKGVARRAPAWNFTTPALNPLCDLECRDEGMLLGLQRFLAAYEADPARYGKPLLLVLHQKGSHGPAYYRRYPPAFERFTPACHSSQLRQCSRQEIINAYDNSVLYTDYVLAKLIALLESRRDRYDPAMFYVSDHGESLGENGVYLHGMPVFMAPDAQVRVAAMLWLGGDKAPLAGLAHQPWSHDHVFHTLLGLLGVQTQVHQPALDILAPMRRPIPLGAENLIR